MMETHVIVYDDCEDGRTALHLLGDSRAVRCAVDIAHRSSDDAIWALKVLNTYGHLVPSRQEIVDRYRASHPLVGTV